MAAERWSATELLAAGWTEADLAWEQTCERALAALAPGGVGCAHEKNEKHNKEKNITKKKNKHKK